MEELIFKYVPVEADLSGVFNFFERGKDRVVILIRDGRGRWVLGRKDRKYYEGISRMVGGAIDKDESPLDAAIRELKEETGAELDEDRLVPLVHTEVTGKVEGRDPVTASLFAFYAQIIEPLTAADDLTGFSFLSDHEFADLVQRYTVLPEMEMSPNWPGATWHDYGLIWGPIHAEAMERVKELGL